MNVKKIDTTNSIQSEILKSKKYTNAACHRLEIDGTASDHNRTNEKIVDVIFLCHTFERMLLFIS